MLVCEQYNDLAVGFVTAALALLAASLALAAELARPSELDLLRKGSLNH